MVGTRNELLRPNLHNPHFTPRSCTVCIKKHNMTFRVEKTHIPDYPGNSPSHGKLAPRSYHWANRIESNQQDGVAKLLWCGLFYSPAAGGCAHRKMHNQVEHESGTPNIKQAFIPTRRAFSHSFVLGEDHSFISFQPWLIIAWIQGS